MQDKLQETARPRSVRVAINQLISKRFAELSEQARAIPIKKSPENEHLDAADSEAFQTWATSALYLVANVFGEGSPHFKNLSTAYAGFHGWAHQLRPARGVFSAATADYEGGYIFSLRATIAGEVFGDFVTAARRALNEENKDVAAVLACAALEDALKRFAQLQGLNVDDKEMSDVINALKAAGLLSGPQKTLIDAMPKIRNAAMHAEWQKITPENVGSVLGFVEQFLLTKFS